MHKTILMMLLSVISSSAVAEWIEVGRNITVGVVFYADPTTIHKSDEKVKMWILVDLEPGEGHSRDKVFKSIKTQREYDCKKKQHRRLYHAFLFRVYG